MVRAGFSLGISVSGPPYPACLYSVFKKKALHGIQGKFLLRQRAGGGMRPFTSVTSTFMFLFSFSGGKPRPDFGDRAFSPMTKSGDVQHQRAMRTGISDASLLPTATI